MELLDGWLSLVFFAWSIGFLNPLLFHDKHSFNHYTRCTIFFTYKKSRSIFFRNTLMYFKTFRWKTPNLNVILAISSKEINAYVLPKIRPEKYQSLKEARISWLVWNKSRVISSLEMIIRTSMLKSAVDNIDNGCILYTLPLCQRLSHSQRHQIPLLLVKI